MNETKWSKLKGREWYKSYLYKQVQSYLCRAWCEKASHSSVNVRNHESFYLYHHIFITSQNNKGKQISSLWRHTTLQMMSYCSQCDLMTSHRRQYDVISTSCSCWEVEVFCRGNVCLVKQNKRIFDAMRPHWIIQLVSHHIRIFFYNPFTLVTILHVSVFCRVDNLKQKTTCVVTLWFSKIMSLIS